MLNIIHACAFKHNHALTNHPEQPHLTVSKAYCIARHSNSCLRVVAKHPSTCFRGCRSDHQIIAYMHAYDHFGVDTVRLSLSIQVTNCNDISVD